MKLAITICATKSYTYAMSAQSRRLQAALSHAAVEKPVIILAGDQSKEFCRVEGIYKQLLPDAEVHTIKCDGLPDGCVNYQEESQLLIAQLRTAAFSLARKLSVDFCLSMDSDVLPPSNSIQMMFDVLALDHGHLYSVATCPYPSQGGGPFLGGRGTVQRQILPDYYEDEREVPEAVVKEMKELRDFLNSPRQNKEITPEIRAEIDGKVKRLQELEKELDKYPPKGNVWELNAKQYRRRGWLDNAYPGIGWGAILPTDWCGFGCTMMNREALNLCHWDGYLGGTEDLFIVWNRWFPRGLKIAVIPHCPCDHVVRDRTKKDGPPKYILCMAHHETEGECVGHMRWRPRPFYNNDLGEKYDPANDGKPNPTSRP